MNILDHLREYRFNPRAVSEARVYAGSEARVYAGSDFMAQLFSRKVLGEPTRENLK